MRRINLAEHGHDALDHDHRVARVQPDVRIAPASLLMLMPVLMIGPMRMGFPGTTLAQWQHRHSGRLQKSHRAQLAPGIIKRLDQEGFQIRPDPEQRIGGRNGTHIRRAQVVIVWRGAAGYQQQRGSHALHHPRHQRMHRLDAGHDLQFSGPGQQGRQQQQQAQTQGRQGEHLQVQAHGIFPGYVIE